jgi:hypothetical protein
MARPTKKKSSRDHGAREVNRAAKLHSDLVAFEHFQDEILPALRADMQAGKTAEELYSKYSALAAARGLSIALGEADASKAMSAVRDILDRTQGKAKESKEIEHRLGKLPDEQLDAFLLTQINELDAIEEADDSEEK